MIRPTGNLALLILGGAIIAIIGIALSPALLVLFALLNAGLIVAAAIDVGGLPRAKELELRFVPPAAVELSHEAEAQVRVRPRREVEVDDARLIIEGSPHLEISGDAKVRITPRAPLSTVTIRGVARGEALIDTLTLCMRGRLGLMERIVRFNNQRYDVTVLPDLGPLRQAMLQWNSARQTLEGLKRMRFIGEGQEFDALREFQPGFDTRNIDWAATARLRKLLVREYRDEKNHQVILAFDSGVTMSRTLGERARLDHAISAGLQLGAICLKAGDRVGLWSFDSEPHLYRPPVGGLQNIRTLARATSSIRFSDRASNFTLSLTELQSRLRRRSIVVILTDFEDSITATLMLEALAMLRRRHVVVFVSLRDPAPGELRLQEPADLEALYEATIADQLVRERRAVIRRIRQLGIICIDVEPRRLGVAMINSYLEIKRRGLI